MKKTVITTLIAAALGLPFMASAQVSVGGKVGMWADNTKVGSTSATTMVTEPTSNFALTAGERVGGLTVRSVIETSLRGNTMGGSNTQLGDRQFTAGLSTSLGSVDFGRGLHSQFLAITNADAFGTLYGSVAGDLHNLRGLRMNDGLYVQLKPIAGIALGVDRSVSGTATSYSLMTRFSGVDAHAARWDGGKDASTVLALQTKMAGVGLSYIRSVDSTGGLKTTADSVGAKATMGRTTFKGTWGRTDRDVTALALGADYSLSKRTEVGLSFRKVDRAGSASDVQGFGVGLTHRF